MNVIKARAEFLRRGYEHFVSKAHYEVMPGRVVREDAGDMLECTVCKSVRRWNCANPRYYTAACPRLPGTSPVASCDRSFT